MPANEPTFYVLEIRKKKKKNQRLQLTLGSNSPIKFAEHDIHGSFSSGNYESKSRFLVACRDGFIGVDFIVIDKNVAESIGFESCCVSF